MKLCLIGKYPPLEGQVSTIAYWLSRSLALRGHSVFVCTNSFDAPEPFRTYLFDDDAQKLEGSFGLGKISVLRTNQFDSRQFYIVPENPTITKLTALGLEAVRHYGCEVIFSNYLEPYAVAAHLISTWTETPHVQTHAGSDVGRLAGDEQLCPVYREILSRADTFVAKSNLARTLWSPDGLALTPAPYAPPPEFFCPSVPALDVNSLLRSARETIQNTLKWHVNAFDPDNPTFGFYGKLFEAKGIFDLISALALLKSRGRRFNLLLMTRWYRGEEKLRQAILDADLTSCTWMLPTLANWHVPGFINACTAIAYLNRDFGTAGHVPVVPDEVLMCGRCLVVSREVQNLSRYRDLLRHGESCLVVNDPKDHREVAKTIEMILDNPIMPLHIGTAGHSAVMERRSHSDFVNSWEGILTRSFD
jgi:glycosyltransferase involved in cell wall biosynthesis